MIAGTRVGAYLGSMRRFVADDGRYSGGVIVVLPFAGLDSVLRNGERLPWRKPRVQRAHPCAITDDRVHAATGIGLMRSSANQPAGVAAWSSAQASALCSLTERWAFRRAYAGPDGVCLAIVSHRRRQRGRMGPNRGAT
jgi:hypothetical protein